ncbi:hypothetical protein [Bacillus safensis]|uniref:hypothetical protein n=1 Tax=Bacillus safensis TaxID=561879 RepID=UPI003F4EB263
MKFWLFCQTRLKFDIKRPLHLLERSQYDVKLKFPADKYPETARHIKNAIKKGASAVCTIDKEGADIEYISPSDNQGAGSWVSHQLNEYEDGTAVLFVVD